jgi:hypothetical protein
MSFNLTSVCCSAGTCDLYVYYSLLALFLFRMRFPHIFCTSLRSLPFPGESKDYETVPEGVRQKQQIFSLDDQYVYLIQLEQSIYIFI